MLQIIVVYFAPYYMFRVKMGPGYRFPAVIIAFVINYAAYFAEIYRSGIESMPNGQYEAAEVLGYNKAQTFIRIILPQVIKRVLPSITNETITLVKDTKDFPTWVQTWAMNFPMAILYQMSYCGPLVRLIFRTIFREKK